MKKLSKNKFAKLFATFLGASTILTPIATLVSCEQITKTPNIQQQKPNPNNNNPSENNGGGTGGETGGGTGSEDQIETTTDTTISGVTITTTTKNGQVTEITATGNITLDKITELANKANNVIINTNGLTIKSFNDKGIIEVTEDNLQAVINKLSVLNIENQDFTKQSITLNIENNKPKITSITGNISLQDIMDSNESNKGIAKYIAKKLKENSDTNFDSSNLTINTFYKKTTGKGASSRNASQRNPEYTYESTPITPSCIEETNLGALKAAALNFKDGDQNIPVHFQSTETNFFDIKKLLHKFNFDSDFKLAVESKIVLGSKETKQTDAGNYDITPYPKVHELLKLLNNEKLKDNISVKDVYIIGNVKDLLPLLVGPNKIKEVDGGVKFLNVNEFKCPGPNVTEYNGGTNNKTPLPVEQLIEFHKRTDEVYDSLVEQNAKSVRLLNLVLENVNTKEINEELLKFLHFRGDFFSENIIFKDSNLSKIDMKGVHGGTANITFEKTVLPRTMKSFIANITLKNVTFPKEEFYKIGTFEDLPYIVPNVGILTIYGEIKDSPLKDLTQEQLKKLKEDEYKPNKMPNLYKGSQEIYDRLKYIYKGESNTIEFINLQGSIQKQQSQLLALLQAQNKSRG